MDAVILCGGQGTRIRHLLPEGCPKAMVDVNETPFIDILIRHLWGSGFEKLILVGGYGWRTLEDHLTKEYLGKENSEKILLYIEHRPRGTAGAIEYAKGNLSQTFFIINGDTYCNLNYGAMLAYHEAVNSVITVACDRELRHVGTFVASRRFVDLIPKADAEVDMAEVFTLLSQKHELVGWFMTDAKYWDIGTPENLKAFRNYWAQLLKGGEGHVVGNIKDPV